MNIVKLLNDHLYAETFGKLFKITFIADTKEDANFNLQLLGNENTGVLDEDAATGLIIIAETTPTAKIITEENLHFRETLEQFARRVTLSMLFNTIDNEDFDDAREKLTPLENAFGYDDPDLSRARWLIEWLEQK